MPQRKESLVLFNEFYFYVDQFNLKFIIVVINARAANNNIEMRKGRTILI